MDDVLSAPTARNLGIRNSSLTSTTLETVICNLKLPAVAPDKSVTTADSLPSSIPSWQWQVELQNLTEKVRKLEGRMKEGTDDNSGPAPAPAVSISNSDRAMLIMNKPPTAAEFMKMCNRVDLLDGKLNLVKKTLDEILTQLKMESKILDKTFQRGSSSKSANSASSLRPRVPKHQASDKHSFCKLAPSVSVGMEMEDDFENEFDNQDQDDDNDDGGWIHPAMEFDEDDEEEENINVDIKPVIHIAGRTMESISSSSHETHSKLRRSTRSQESKPSHQTVEVLLSHQGDEYEDEQAEEWMPEDIVGNDEPDIEQSHARPRRTSVKMQPKRVRPAARITKNTNKIVEGPSSTSQLFPNPESRYPPLDSNVLEKNPDTRLYECPVCYKPFKEKKKVERHYVVHSGERPFSCVICDKTYTRKDKLTEHYRIEHPEHIPADHVFEKKEKATFVCADCGKVSANRSNHEDHMNACRGDKPHQCTTCGRGFTQKASLNNHISCVHQKLRRFLCDDCGKSFSISTSYQRHMRMHRGERPFPCKYCLKTFGDKSDVRRHERAHTGVKNVKCTLCELAFYKPYSLKQHMITHTGEKPFVCDECGTKFGKGNSLKKHKLLHLKGDVRIRKSPKRKGPYKPRKSRLLLVSTSADPSGAAKDEEADEEISDLITQTQSHSEQYALIPEAPLHAHNFSHHLAPNIPQTSHCSTDFNTPMYPSSFLDWSAGRR